MTSRATHLLLAALALGMLAGVVRGETAPTRPLPGEPLAASLADLSLEQLGDIEVTSVSRRAERLLDAAASIYVITADDIRRSGAKTLPELLRLAPTLQVARADANRYAISARGFNSVLANKILVLVDGRTVYSPLFSGVFWEAQDLLLDAVERIEVITGTGGTLWGTNAVNGVINVITRDAGETQGVLALVGAGNELKAAGARYGGSAGEGVRYRAWAKYSDQDNTELARGASNVDASRRVHGGFRADWGAEKSRFFLQGGASSAEIEQLPEARQISGFHLLGRWSRELSATSNLQLQAYWDRTNRHQPGAIRDALDTFDFEFQHGFQPAARHDLFWGAGYRYQSDQLTNLNPATFRLIPDDQILRIGYAFVEDGVTLSDGVRVVLGLKAEHNIYTHTEFLPSVRMSWKPAADHLLWGALSRAVRAPARVDREFFSPGSPPHIFYAGGPDFVSEVSEVAELGYRAQPMPPLSLSLTGYYHHHDRLRSLEPTPDGPQFKNGINGKTYGAEAWAKYRLTGHWRLSGGIVHHRRDVWLDPGSLDINGRVMLGNDPRYWWSLGTAFDHGSRVEWDLMLRQVGPLPNPAVPRYTTIDARVGLLLVRGLDLSVTGRNLLQPEHAEWGAPAERSLYERTAFVQLRWQWPKPGHGENSAR